MLGEECHVDLALELRDLVVEARALIHLRLDEQEERDRGEDQERRRDHGNGWDLALHEDGAPRGSTPARIVNENAAPVSPSVRVLAWSCTLVSSGMVSSRDRKSATLF